MTELVTTATPIETDIMGRLRAKAGAVFNGVISFFNKGPLTRILALLALFLGPQAVMAIAAPATGTFAYDLYDLAVNDILNGPIGFVGGLAVIVYGASQLMRSWMVALLAIMAGSVIIEADAIVTSLGALI